MRKWFDFEWWQWLLIIGVAGMVAVVGVSQAVVTHRDHQRREQEQRQSEVICEMVDLPPDCHAVP